MVVAMPASDASSRLSLNHNDQGATATRPEGSHVANAPGLGRSKPSAEGRIGERFRQFSEPAAAISELIIEFCIARLADFPETDQCDLGRPVPFAKIFCFTPNPNHF
jgi:hypothetical protein